MNTVRAIAYGVLVLCAAGVLTSACSKMDSDVKDDPLVSTDSGPKDIFTAAETGDLERVRELIQAGNWDPSEMDGRAMRPLDCAIEGGNADIVRLMVEHGADANSPGPNGTPLHHAKESGTKEVEQVLVELGARE